MSKKRSVDDRTVGSVASNAEPAHHAQGVAPGDAGGSDATVTHLLAALFAASKTPAGALSTNTLERSTGQKAIMIRRYLTALEEAGLIRMHRSPDGSGSVALTAAGVEACARFLADNEPSADES